MQEDSTVLADATALSKTTINQAFCAFGLLSSHFFASQSPHTTAFLDYYFRVKTAQFKGTELLIDAFQRFDPELQTLTAKLLLLTPLPNFGCFGEAHPECLPTLTAIKSTKEKSLKNLIKELKKVSPIFDPVYKEVSNETLISQAQAYLKNHQTLTVHAANKQGIKFVKIVKALFDIAALVAPKHRIKNFKYHHNIVNEAFLTADIKIPTDLAQDIHRSYVDTFKDHVPISVFLTLLYQSNLGVDRLPNLATLGHLFGFSGHETNNFNYLKKHNSNLTSFISEKYNLHYDMVCRIQRRINTSAPPTHLDYYDGEVQTTFLPESVPLNRSPFYLSNLKDGPAVGHSAGKRIVDHTNVDYGDNFTEEKFKFKFEFDIRLLTTANQARGGRSSLFTNERHEIRAFQALVETNPITRPDLSLRKPIVNKKWLPIFDEYLKTDFSMEQLLGVLKQDLAFFVKIRPTVRNLYKKVQKNRSAIKKLTDEEIEDYFQNNTELFDPLDYESKTLFAYYRRAADLWFEELKVDPVFKTRKIVTIKQTKGKKTRVVCRTPLDVALFEKFSNRIFQVVYQHININVFGLAVSNYLPGTSAPLSTMERFKAAIEHTDIDLCNLDVKSCFDSVNLLHPNFEKRLDLGLLEIEKLIAKPAADFLKFVFKDFLLQNIKEDKFLFKKSKTYKGDLPVKGALPTGFVLSPALWLVLALPALVKTQEQVKKGNLLCYDLCGDDFIAAAPRNTPEDIKEEISKPWFELASDLDLKFHFFKNYTDCRVPVADKWKHLFDDKKKATQESKSAWVSCFPARSIPIFHGGVCLARKTIIEVVTSLRDVTKKKVESKFYMSLYKKKQHKVANFVPKALIKYLSEPGSRFDLLNRSEANREVLKTDVNLNEILFGGQQFCGKHFDSESKNRNSRFHTYQTKNLFLKSRLDLHIGSKGGLPTITDL